MKCPRCGYENAPDALCCNLCQTVLRREKAAESGAHGETAPAPGKADYAAFAAQFVANSGPTDPFVGGFGVLLDYSPASIAALDEFISVTWGTKGESPGSDDYQPSKGKTNIMIQFGSYFGEVVKRQLGGVWEEDPQHPANPFWTKFCLPNGTQMFPITKVLKRFKNGAEDAMMPLLFTLSVQIKPESRPAMAPGFLKQAEHFMQKSALPLEMKIVLARQFAQLAVGLDPNLKSPALAAIFEQFAKLDPAAVKRQAEEQDAIGAPEAPDFGPSSNWIVTRAARYGITLDYSTAGLAALDAWIAEVWDQEKGAYRTKGKPAWDAELWPLGCYLGETLKRAAGAQWKPDLKDKLKSSVSLNGGAALDPFAWIAERSESGPKRSLYARLAEVLPATPERRAKDLQWLLAQAETLAQKPAGDAAALSLIDAALTLDGGQPGALCNKGFLLLPMRRYDEALASFEKALALAPSADAWDGKAGALAGLGKSPEAAAACAEALKLDPKAPSPHCRLGGLMRAAKKDQEALAEYDRALALDKGCAPALYAKGQVLMARGERQGALADFERFRRIRGASPWHGLGLCVDQKTHAAGGRDCSASYLVYYPMALCEYELDKYAAAAGSLSSFLGAPPAGHEAEVEDAKRRLPVVEACKTAWELDASGTPEAFLEAAKKALALDPARLNIRREVGVAHAIAGRYDESLKAMDENLAIDPDHKLTIANKGTVLSKMGRVDDAIVLFERAMALDCADMSSWKNKAVCLRDLKQPERFARFLDETLAAKPGHELALLFKGDLELKSGRLDAAKGLYRTFLAGIGPATDVNLINGVQRQLWDLENTGRKRDPQAAAALIDAANAEAMAMRFAQAVPLFQRALELDPLNANAWCNLCTALAFTSRFDEALRSVERACELDPRDESSWKMRAQLLEQVESREEALSCWQRLNQWWPKNVEYWRCRGWCCNHLRRFDEAVSCFDEALRLDPRDKEVALKKAAVLDRAGKTEPALALAREALGDESFIKEARAKGEKEFDYLLCKESSPGFAALLKGAFAAQLPR
ncbi:MAG: tetratricopeptide repeat protein [Elusimicrobia bacterium]|nr:tetratricopeptide repeat protein [Elusimicrobiota bacterium]